MFCVYVVNCFDCGISYPVSQATLGNIFVGLHALPNTYSHIGKISPISEDGHSIWLTSSMTSTHKRLTNKKCLLETNKHHADTHTHTRTPTHIYNQTGHQTHKSTNKFLNYCALSVHVFRCICNSESSDYK